MEVRLWCAGQRIQDRTDPSRKGMVAHVHSGGRLVSVRWDAGGTSCMPHDQLLLEGEIDDAAPDRAEAGLALGWLAVLAGLCFVIWLLHSAGILRW